MEEGYTLHAVERMQQRSISEQAVDLITEFGRAIRHKGADVYALDQRGRDAVRRKLGALRYLRLEHQLGAYVVFEDGYVITVGHRFGRLKR